MGLIQLIDIACPPSLNIFFYSQRRRVVLFNLNLKKKRGSLIFLKKKKTPGGGVTSNFNPHKSAEGHKVSASMLDGWGEKKGRILNGGLLAAILII